MKTWQDIAGVAFLFTAGVAASVYLGAFPHTISTTYHIIASGTILLSSALLMYSRRRRWDRHVQCGLIAACVMSCGAFIGMSGVEMQVSEIPPEGPLTIAAHKAAKGVEALIGSIPFTNEHTGGSIKALLTGNREDIPQDVAQAFRDSGASHILALSGLHLGIIYAVVRFMTRCLGNSQKAKAARSVILICTCGFYTLATGAGASIVRAFIFILMGEAARLSGRPAGLRKVMMAALLIHLTIMPSSIKELGFQLSYAAIAGIAYIFPWLQGFWPGDRHEDAALTKCARWIWESAAMSISCQITTGPLAYIYFGTFPTQFILTNMIALPLTGIIIPMALVTLVTCSMGWNVDILINGTEFLVTLLCGSLDLLSTM